jgi:hypothetical protein
MASLSGIVTASPSVSAGALHRPVGSFILLLPGGVPGLVPYLQLWILMPKRRDLIGQPILLRPLFFQHPAGFHYSIFVPDSRHDEAGWPEAISFTSFVTLSTVI